MNHRIVKPSPAMIVALIALVTALSGQALALVVTGADIKNGTITGRDVRNGGLAAADLAASTRASLTDTSPWETIPSGRTIVGEIGYDDDTTRAADFRQWVSFGARARTPLTDATVNFAVDANPSTTDDDASCTGSTDHPTAPAGKVCLYLFNFSGDMTDVRGSANLYMTRSGFNVYWSDNDDVVLRATWAYRAP